MHILKGPNPYIIAWNAEKLKLAWNIGDKKLTSIHACCSSSSPALSPYLKRESSAFSFPVMLNKCDQPLSNQLVVVLSGWASKKFVRHDEKGGKMKTKGKERAGKALSHILSIKKVRLSFRDEHVHIFKTSNTCSVIHDGLLLLLHTRVKKPFQLDCHFLSFIFCTLCVQYITCVCLCMEMCAFVLWV